MLKLMVRQNLQFYDEKFCLSKPVYFNVLYTTMQMIILYVIFKLVLPF